ncbi:MAG: hypothetical protein M1835_000617 [Candelina submexicana]|nr:MAG: hypothetical protein M1835_000617 [Candelina submexicana]
MYCAATATTQTTSYRNLKVVSTTSPLPTSSAAASSTTTAAASTVTVELSLNPLLTSTSTSPSTITVISSTYSPTAAAVGKTHLSPGAIAGIAIAAVLGIAIISALIFYCIICRRRKRDISNAGGFSSDKPSPGLKSPSFWANSLWGKKSTPSASTRLDTGLGISTNPSNHRNGAHPATPELPETPRSAELPSEADGGSPREPLHPYSPATAFQPMPTMAEESFSAYPMAAPPLQQQLRPQSRQQHEPASSQYIAYSPHHHNSLPVSEMSTPTNSILEAGRPSTGFASDSGFGTPNDTGNVRGREHRVSATGWEGGYITPETVMAGGWTDEYPRAYGQVRRS